MIHSSMRFLLLTIVFSICNGCMNKHAFDADSIEGSRIVLTEETGFFTDFYGTRLSLPQ